VTFLKQKRSEDILLVAANYRMTSEPDQKSW